MFVWGTKAKIAVSAVIFIALLGYHHVDKYLAVQSATSVLHEGYRIKMQEEVLKAQKTEIELRDRLQEDNRIKDERIKTLSIRLDALNNSLSERSTRAERNSSPAGDSITCTGAELSREDGEFLAGEAARADKILLERDYYYEQYERAREISSPD